VIYDMDSSLAEQLADSHALFRPLLPLLRRIEQWAIRSAEVVTPMCRDLAAYAAMLRATHDDVVVLHDVPVEAADASRSSEQPSSNGAGPQCLALYVGNLEPYQGIDLLVDAAALLPADSSLRIQVVGGPMAAVERFRKSAAERGVHDRVQFLGPRPLAHLHDLLATADILLSPRTKGYNTPLKLYSYMESGRPILATRLRTHTQVLDDSTALLAEPEAGAYAQGLVRLEGDEDLRRKLGEAAERQVRREYSPMSFSSRVRAIYGQSHPRPSKRGTARPRARGPARSVAAAGIAVARPGVGWTAAASPSGKPDTADAIRASPKRRRGMRCVVTGATGHVGRHLCRELATAGHEVIALHRASSDTSPLEGLDVGLREGDVRDPASLMLALDGAERVFHLAALFREAKHPDSEYWAVNLEGTRNVLDASVSCGVRKVVHCSTVGVHSHIPDPPADETEDYRPADTYQKSKCAGEKLALDYFRSGHVAGCVVRPAMVWGPGDVRLRKLFRGIQRRRLPLVGSGKTLLHWVDVRDVAHALRLAAERPDGSGEVYIVAGAGPIQMQQLFRLIADEVGTPLLPFRIPALPLQLLGEIVEAVCKPLGIEPPLYRRRVDFFTKTRAFDWSKARDELGYRPSGSIVDEVRDIIRSYHELGWLD
jgi:nucleoside-diphosphate-sugar epimerase